MRVPMSASVLVRVTAFLAALNSASETTIRPTPPTIKKKENQCPMAFHEIGTRCYFYGYFPLNWYRAAEFCHSFGRGVSLTTIETVQENYYIKQWLSVNGEHSSGVWVGGSDNGHHGLWSWFPTGQILEYKNWGPSQPSGKDQHCMYLVGGLLGYQWADFHCDFSMHFLCEYNVDDVQPW